MFFKYPFLLLLFSSIAFGQDYYVSDSNGLDTNDGSESFPFKTINRAISSVSAGGTIFVMEGTYNNNNYGFDSLYNKEA